MNHKSPATFSILLAAFLLLVNLSGCELSLNIPTLSVPTTEELISTRGTEESGDDNSTLSPEPTITEPLPSTEATSPNTEPSAPTTEPSIPTTEPSIPETTPPTPTECTHDWSNWLVVKAAACTEEGSKKRTCSKCGVQEQRLVAATGHKMSDWTIKAATCTSNGEKTRACVNCGKTEAESIPPEGHAYGSWTIVSAATCTIDGTEKRVCAKCDQQETQAIGAIGHAWDEGKVVVTPVDCSEKGVKTYVCQTCSETKDEQFDGSHSFGEWEYEEYTYQKPFSTPGFTHLYRDVTSHRKVRLCAKCTYKETDGTPEHHCVAASSNHTEVLLEEAICGKSPLYRSTCNICGWSTEYRSGPIGDHTGVTETRHLTDYGPYTNELDVKFFKCTVCGVEDMRYIWGEGSEYRVYAVNIVCLEGNSDELSPEHPENQIVKRDFVYDSDGYVTQFTLHWLYKGKRYSEVIKCDKASMIAWFAEYGLDTTVREGSYSIICNGTYFVPYRFAWAG